MRTRWIILAAALAAALPDRLPAQTQWDNRDPNSTYYFQTLRARNPGDVLTIMIEESTGSDNQEKREMDKKTKLSSTTSGKGSSSSLGAVLRSFAGDLDLQNASQRSFDGKANATMTRNFTDRLSVIVIDVMPNGNMIVEGSRQRMIAREMRTLRVRGIVRPADVGPYNTVQSQFLANLYVSYEGRGPESAYSNQNWGGRIFNKVWPH